MSELKPVSTTDKGVRFTVDCALMGRDVRLRKHALGNFSYICPFCGAKPPMRC